MCFNSSELAFLPKCFSYEYSVAEYTGRSKAKEQIVLNANVYKDEFKKFTYSGNLTADMYDHEIY